MKLQHCTWIAATACALAAPAAARPPARQPALPEIEQRIVDGTNRLRQAAGRGAAAPNAQLEAAARGFAEFMARTDQYGHQADGRQAAQRTQERGYAHCMMAENIAYQFSSARFRSEELADQFVQGWRDSPGHRRNMLDPDATETGVAVARSPKSGRYYAVQLFARPQALRIRFEIGNRGNATVHYVLDEQSFELPPRVTRTHEQCRAARLVLRLPGDAEPVSLQPADGERWRVERTNARWHVQRG
ncbi:CAP domain-containing protein [Aquincola sp. S2]|uniref:CAP domain-containing protein n=1 Tax=Pseudaquabacterium terrae TaxID=2732868 RepID=A0ABX2EJG5_9BURK|nr:CAP domain-containing protein [Aquabacterium terrae]NRF68792.1 CAP domain-containing protein [Aquabacterium terrae]